MKRINPQTGEVFKPGDTREDGRIFHKYKMHGGPRSNGYYGEQWLTSEALAKERERASQYLKTWAMKNKESEKLKKKLKYHANPDKYASSTMKATYGITLEQYRSILKSQHNVCVVCRNGEVAVDKNGKTRRLAIDHCHSTGIIRGLLCSQCNTALGLMKDNAENIRRLAFYSEVANTGYTSPGY